MKLLLLFLLGTFAIAVATADREAARPRTIALLGICALVAFGYTTLRFV